MLDQHQLHQVVLTFLTEHKSQIERKAIKFGLDPDDFAQDVALFILEHGPRHDSSRASFAAFVFGSLEKKVKRKTVNVLRFAQSIDQDFCYSINARCAVESVIAENACPADRSNDQTVQNSVPGAANLLAIADVVSGMSAREIAKRSKRSKRRVNQILKKMRDEARTQFALNFGCGEA